MKRTAGDVVVGSALGAVGAAFAALLGTLCCAGPAVVAVIGASGALAAARIEPYRPYLLGLSVVFLAIGFWRAYAPARASRQGAVCKVSTGRHVRMILWVATTVTAASAIAPRFL